MEEKSSYEISIVEDEDIVEITLRGMVSREEVKALQDKIFAALKPINKNLFLFDCRKIEGRFGFGEAFFRARSYPADRYSPENRTAIVDHDENMSFQQFYETTAHNVGLKVRCFQEIDDARAWLKNEGYKQNRQRQ